MNMLSTRFHVIIVVDITLMILAHLSVMMATNWLPALVLGSVLKISLATSLRAPADANNSHIF